MMLVIPTTLFNPEFIAGLHASNTATVVFVFILAVLGLAALLWAVK